MGRSPHKDPSDPAPKPAEEARKQVLRRTGNAELVERLVPVQPGDEQAAQRGRILFGTIFKDVSEEDVAIRVRSPLSHSFASVKRHCPPA